MSDWGRVAFYYDYVAHNKRKKENERVRGLISKAYKYPGVDQMILHAYNGIRYFMDHKDIESYRGMHFDGKQFDDDHSGMAELNQAFDTFFECGHISLGYSDVEQVIDASSMVDKKEMAYQLYQCEGMYGWLYIRFTGNHEDGFSLKYGYEYGYVNNEWDIVDVEKALAIYKDKHKLSSEDILPQALLDEAVQFFKENAVLMSKDEFYEMESLGIDWVCDMRKERQNRSNP